jgi:DNA-binding transcriptional MerR regulator
MSESGPRRYTKGVYRLGETAEMLGVEGHVLRFWELQFPQLTPRKSPGGQRRYTPEDIDLLFRIRELLYVEGFTISGARRQLEEGAAAGSGGGAAADLVRDARREIRAILTLLGGDDKL